MSEVSPRFRELSEQIGGFSEEALESLIFIKSPLDLHHWTMNVIEVLLIAGAIWGLVHAVNQARLHGNVLNIGVWVASVVYMLVIEIPVYFPEKIGGDPNNVMFLHNEFTIGFFYNRAPLYIVALYPALAYPAYVLIAQTGIFERRWGTLLGAISVGFVHHVFYELFDHFGPQYGWWIWNYSQFVGTLAAVPVSSLFGFAFIGPIALVLSVHLTLGRYLARRAKKQLAVTGAGIALWTVAAGVLTPVMLALLSPQLPISILGIDYTPQVEAMVCFSLLALAGVSTLYLVLATEPSISGKSSADRFGFAWQFLGLYLLTFAGLWLYALPDYFAATDGITSSGLRTGSLPYVLGSFLLCGFFLARARLGSLKRGAAVS